MAMTWAEEAVVPAKDKKELAGQLIGVMKLEESMVKSIDRVKAVAESQTEMMASRMGVDMTKPEVAETVRMRVLELVLSEYRWADLRPEFVKIYADLFTVEELEGLIAFYESPLGAKLLEKQPELIRLSSEATQNRVADLIPKIELIVMDARINRLKGKPDKPPGPSVSTTP